MSSTAPRVLLIACGALAREVLTIIEQRALKNVHLTCLPAKLHNYPSKIPEGVRTKIRAARGHYDKILVLYGDCGTSGMLDAVLQEEGVERIPGPHCYAFFSGLDRFAQIMDDDPTKFFLTDFLARHFDKLIVSGFGLDRHPEMKELLFGNYRGVVYLAQTRDAELLGYAERAAQKLGLPLEIIDTGYGELESFLSTSS